MNRSLPAPCKSPMPACLPPRTREQQGRQHNRGQALSARTSAHGAMVRHVSTPARHTLPFDASALRRVSSSTKHVRFGAPRRTKTSDSGVPGSSNSDDRQTARKTTRPSVCPSPRTRERKRTHERFPASQCISPTNFPPSRSRARVWSGASPTAQQRRFRNHVCEAETRRVFA